MESLFTEDDGLDETELDRIAEAAEHPEKSDPVFLLWKGPK